MQKYSGAVQCKRGLNKDIICQRDRETETHSRLHNVLATLFVCSAKMEIIAPNVNYIPAAVLFRVTTLTCLRRCNPGSSGRQRRLLELAWVCLKLTFSVNLDPTTVEEAGRATQG